MIINYDLTLPAAKILVVVKDLNVFCFYVFGGGKTIEAT